MKFIAALLLWAGVASAQIISIACGSPVPVGNYGSDKYFTGGVARAKDTTIGTGIYQTSRYSNKQNPFSYRIPVLAGTYNVVLQFSDPSSTAKNQRVFTVTINGNKTDPLDIYALAGRRTPYSPPLYVVNAVAGFIDLVFQSTAGNADVNGIQVFPNTITAPVKNQTLFCVWNQQCVFPTALAP